MIYIIDILQAGLMDGLVWRIQGRIEYRQSIISLLPWPANSYYRLL